MIKIENVKLASPEQMEFIIQGMRNPMNSWDKSDSHYLRYCDDEFDKMNCNGFLVENKDYSLMKSLSKAGTDHRKYMRMMPVYVRITAPMYWWVEADTYKVGTVRNSCSKMHKLLSKPFEMSDFSIGYKNNLEEREEVFKDLMQSVINALNELRDAYLSFSDRDAKKGFWYAILQLLPESYNQTSNVMMNYEVLANIYKSRKDHKLDEWHDFCEWIRSLPYSELITGERV